jgi:hypothetical protein
LAPHFGAVEARLYFGLVERACRLGWPRPKDVALDEDLGLSTASTFGRVGFQRLVAEVGRGHVGLVLGPVHYVAHLEGAARR